MSQLTADTLLPLIAALPADEQAVLAEKLNKMVAPVKKTGNKKKDIYEEIGDIFRPENREILLNKLVNGERL